MVQRHEVLEITIDNLVPTKWVRSGSNYEIVTFETIDAAKSWIKEWTTEEKSESDTINEQYFLDGEIDNRVDDLE